MAEPAPGSASEFIEQQLDERMQAIEQRFDADGLSFTGPLLFRADDMIRSCVEKLHARGSGKTKLIVILTTTGGYIEVVQRIVATFRQHYSVVEFVVPNHAYSAGTVLVMSGNAIHMDYYSRLGPIDPQVEREKGSDRMVPALGYLEQYNRLIKKAQDQTITTAEVQLLIDGFDQAELYHYEQARELSITLLKEWLVKYKFRDWDKTEDRKLTVTKTMKTNRASQIAKELNKTKKWHVHGHGISMDVLRKDLKLKIDDFGASPELNRDIKCYYDLLTDYQGKMGVGGAIHFRGTYTPMMAR